MSDDDAADEDVKKEVATGLDAAFAKAARIPLAHTRTVEVRPVREGPPS